MDEVALKPCPSPWCESHEHRAVPKLADDLWTIDGGNAVRIECPSCEMLGPRRSTEAEAVEAWNRRAQPGEESALAGAIYGIEEALGFLETVHPAARHLRGVMRDLDALRRTPVEAVPDDVVEADEQFANAVWEALKGDHTDLRKQAIILQAHRSAIPALPSERAIKVGNDTCPKCLSAHPPTFDCTLPPIISRPASSNRSDGGRGWGITRT
jgi:hypothetical protein